MASLSHPSNNNPTGINQFKDCRSYCFYLDAMCHFNCLIVAGSDDARVESLIRDYDRRNIVNKDLISKMLLAEHGIQMRCVMLFLLCELIMM